MARKSRGGSRRFGRGEHCGRRLALLNYSNGGVFFLFVAAGGAWLFLKLLMCWGGAGTYLCDQSYFAPLVLGAVVLAFFVWTLVHLHGFGREFERRRRRKLSVMHRVRQSAVRMQHGLNRLPSHRRKHVYMPGFYNLAILGGFIGFLAFYLDIPALGAVGAGVVFPLLVVVAIFVVLRRLAHR